jgi:SAM-dependent methyltransferase
LAGLYRAVIPAGSSVLEVGCAQADLLAALAPRRAVGVDLSETLIDQARKRHPNLEFHVADVHDLALGETFDYIVCSDLLNDLWDVQCALERLRSHAHPGTRLVLNIYNHLWESARQVAQAAGLVTPVLEQNWLSSTDLANLLRLAGFEIVNASHEILCPVALPLLEPLANRLAARLPVVRHLALVWFVVARPAAEQRADVRVSVVVPARNEEGNIEAVVRRTPELGLGTEIVFVEGHSKDGTWAAIEAAVAAHPERAMKALQQPGQGKGDAVRAGFAAASGEFFMILDADLTVAPEDLPRFYEAWRSGRAEFVNGVRLVYPLERGAMRFFNKLGNKTFSLLFTWLLGQNVKDTLCGTKALSREHYEAIAANRHAFGDFDPFGDFDLLFGAARLGLRIADVPVRYGERTYGTTNIRRWHHGWLLFRMAWIAFRRLRCSAGAPEH